MGILFKGSNCWAIQNCYLRSENRLLVGIGLNNLIVVETNDAILISDKDHSQLVKDIVQKLKDKNISEGLQHSKITGHGGTTYQSLMIQDGKLNLLL